MQQELTFQLCRLLIILILAFFVVSYLNPFAVKITDVIGFVCPNVSGSLAVVLKHLSSKGIFIEYMYSFANGDVAHVIIRPSDLDACEAALSEIKVDLLAANDLYQL